MKPSTKYLDTITNSLAGGGITGIGAANRKLAKSKSRKLFKSRNPRNSRAMEKPKFLISKARGIFNYLKQAFTKTSILQHFDLEHYIWIRTNISGYAIDGILSQLTLDHLILSDLIFSKSDFGQWHLVAYFFMKMILA